MTRWNFADVWESVAGMQPERAAIHQGDRTVSWAEFNRHANALARFLVERGLTHQSKIGAYLRNSPEYLMAYFAAYKAGLIPFNINFRYGANELLYLLENADAEAIVFHTEFAELVDTIRNRAAKVICWIAVPQPGHPIPDWAIPFGDIVSAYPGGDFRASWDRSPDDIMMLYTGGTTGLPKGVMWRQEDAFSANGGGGNFVTGLPPMVSLDEGMKRLAAAQSRPVRLVCPPLMHGAGLSPSQSTLNAGGAVILLTSRGFDATEAWPAIERHRAEAINIVGTAFALPMAEALEHTTVPWDLSSVRAIFSSGAMLDSATRRTLLKHCPNAMIIDKLGASEISSLGEAITRPGQDVKTAVFTPSKGCTLISADGYPLELRPGARGLLASSHLVALGYYKDANKTAETFREIGGVRFGVSGDYAEIDADGNIRLLGRESQCINTGGEKVFAEEVEEALKSHPKVRDAAVVGVPDPRFGSKIFAVVELVTSSSVVTLAELAEHAGRFLAPFKLPRALRVVPSIDRLPNGKLDYKKIKAMIQVDQDSLPGPV